MPKKYSERREEVVIARTPHLMQGTWVVMTFTEFTLSQSYEILRSAQNDKKRRVRNDTLRMSTYLCRSL